ncbi:MAG: NYN domain-containing protein [Candidatus Nanoarchaeia archaeon]|nr:NYN domain-containing protein [Candidatus Nanoarchaeia archaeon]MDD5740787.1 NYN domain-containing protein [Candidatus Nanoarchaeia archaeon]
MRTSIFIDGNNFYHGLRHIYGKDKSLKRFNFQKFLNSLAKSNEIQEIFYYNAELDKSHNLKKYKSQKQFFDNLSKILNLKLILCKLLKRKIKGTNKYYYVLKEDDIHMAIDMVEGACDDRFDIAILISGDGDFVPAVKAVQRKDKIVKNIYFKKSSSRNLKEHCDKSLELTKEILDKFFK